MKRIVLTFGLIAGAIMSVLMAVTLPFHDKIGFDRSLILGYTTMVIASLLIYFGVRAYRDNVGGGKIGFGRALWVGLLIGAVASLCYVATWQVIYFNFAPDYLEKYQVYMLDKARAEGASDAELAKKKAELEKFNEMYQNPAINAAYTILEPLPVVLIFALVSAGLLSRGRKGGAGEEWNRSLQARQ